MVNLVPYLFIVCPSLIGLSFYNKLLKNKNKKFEYIRFILYIFFSNILTLMFLNIFSEFNENLYDKLASSTSYSYKYAFILLFFNLIVGYVDFIKVKFFDFEIEEKNEKKH